MIKIKGTSKLLSYEIQWNPKTRQSHNKLRSQMEKLCGKSYNKIYERNEIHNSCSLQSKQITALKILFIVLNVGL